MVVSKRSSVVFFRFLSRNLSSSRKLPRIRCLNIIPPIYKSRAIEEAQKALRQYLHANRSLPFVFAELIAKNSPFSLANLIRKVHFSAPKFAHTFTKLLMYEPINEFEFFFESIGIHHGNVPALLPRGKFFFSEDHTVLAAASALSGFGFPWNKLGNLYVDEVSIFSKSPDELADRLSLLKEHSGFDSLCVVGVCLAFPRLLSFEGEFGSDDKAIFDDLKKVYRESGEGSCVEGNVDDWYELCCKVRIFYGLGCEKGSVGELFSLRKDIFLRCPAEILARKVDYFCRFGGRNLDVGLWILRNPDILTIDLETRAISVTGLLQHVGFDPKQLKLLRKKNSHVFGRNKIANLPHVMKALDLHEWCFEQIKSSNGQLLATYSLTSPELDKDEAFMEALKTIESRGWGRHTMGKVDFLNGIGFGENAATLKILKRLHGSNSKLVERFDCLVRMGIKHSDLCLMIKSVPNILCMSPENLEKKSNFLRQETGSLEYLYGFPDFLCYDFENRIKRRCKLYAWLRETGLFDKKYSIAYMLSASENQFIGRLYEVHPAAPKRYLEFFSYKDLCPEDYASNKCP